MCSAGWPRPRSIETDKAANISARRGRLTAGTASCIQQFLPQQFLHTIGDGSPELLRERGALLQVRLLLVSALPNRLADQFLDGHDRRANGDGVTAESGWHELELFRHAG